MRGLAAAAGLLLLLLLPGKATADPHDDLCEALKSEGANLGAVRTALEAGASPNDTCSFPYTSRQIHAPGAIMSVLTGGLWLLTPMLDEDLLTKEVVRYETVNPLRLAADTKNRALMKLLVEFGADVQDLEFAFQAAVVAGDLPWAGELGDMGAPRRLERIPDSMLTSRQLDELLALRPEMGAVTISWSEDAVRRFAEDPTMIHKLVDAGLDPTKLRGAFSAGVRYKQYEFVASLETWDVDRHLWEIDQQVLADEQEMQQVMNLRPDLGDLRIHGDGVQTALKTNPRLLDQLVAYGYDPLPLAFDALYSDDFESIDVLIEHGMDVNGATEHRFHKHLLNQAVDDDNVEAVRFLVDRGAVPKMGVFDHPITKAASDDNHEIVEIMLDGMEDRETAQRWWLDLVETAAIFDDAELADLCLQDGRAAGHRYGRAVQSAVMSHSVVLMERLVRESADPEADAGVALATAADQGNVEMVALALELGADPEVVVDGRTPIHEAIDINNDEIIAALVAAGADPNRLDGDGHQPLWFALYEGQWTAAGALLAAGAVPDEATVEMAVIGRGRQTADADLVWDIALADHQLPPATWTRMARKARWYGRDQDVVYLLKVKAKDRRQEIKAEKKAARAAARGG